MRKYAWLLTIGLFMAGCASTLKPCPELLREQVSFISDGKTTRQELLDRLGASVSQYEEGRIHIYVMRQDGQDRLRVPQVPLPSDSPQKVSWHPEVYNLVLVFGADGVLERHALLRVR